MKPLFDPKVDLKFTYDEFKEAKDELIKLSQNDKERALYELREKANKDRTSALEDAEEKGIKKEQIKIIKNGIENDIPIDTLCLLTNLTKEEIQKIYNNQY